MRIGIASSERELPPSDRELVAALGAIGFEAVVVDWKDAERDWSWFDAVMVRSCWDYHLHAERFLAWVRDLEGCGVVVVNQPALIVWNSDKIYLRSLAISGVEIPDTIYLGNGEEIELADVCAKRGWDEAVVKPIVSASAHRTERRKAGAVRGPAMVQRFISAIESLGEWSLIFIGGQYSHAVNKKPAENDFRVQEEHGGTVVAGAAPAGAREFAEHVLTLLPWPAVFARVDLVVEGEQIWLMELEVIEPELYLHLCEGSAGKLAGAVGEYLSAKPGTKT